MNNREGRKMEKLTEAKIKNFIKPLNAAEFNAENELCSVCDGAGCQNCDGLGYVPRRCPDDGGEAGL